MHLGTLNSVVNGYVGECYASVAQASHALLRETALQNINVTLIVEQIGGSKAGRSNKL